MQIGVDFTIALANKFISAAIGANVVSDNYTKCVNQLNANERYILAKCNTDQKESIEEACNG
jgi:hypothetical protein